MQGVCLAGVSCLGDLRRCKTVARSHQHMTGVVGASSRLDAEYSAIYQDKEHRLTWPWKGRVVEAASPWAGATPKGDLYVGDDMDLYTKDLSARVGAPLEGGTGLGCIIVSAVSVSVVPSEKAWQKTCTSVTCSPWTRLATLSRAPISPRRFLLETRRQTRPPLSKRHGPVRRRSVRHDLRVATCTL